MGRAEPPGGNEAEGRGTQFVATCFNCGAHSYIGADWKWFTCWKCGATSGEMVAYRVKLSLPRSIVIRIRKS